MLYYKNSYLYCYYTMQMLGEGEAVNKHEFGVHSLGSELGNGILKRNRMQEEEEENDN